jgi:hypothetical protein
MRTGTGSTLLVDLVPRVFVAFEAMTDRSWCGGLLFCALVIADDHAKMRRAMRERTPQVARLPEITFVSNAVEQIEEGKTAFGSVQVADRVRFDCDVAATPGTRQSAPR